MGRVVSSAPLDRAIWVTPAELAVAFVAVVVLLLAAVWVTARAVRCDCYAQPDSEQDSDGGGEATQPIGCTIPSPPGRRLVWAPARPPAATGDREVSS